MNSVSELRSLQEATLSCPLISDGLSFNRSFKRQKMRLFLAEQTSNTMPTDCHGLGKKGNQESRETQRVVLHPSNDEHNASEVLQGAQKGLCSKKHRHVFHPKTSAIPPNNFPSQSSIRKQMLQYQRLMAWKRQRQCRQKRCEQQRREKEIEGCTFHPDISKSSKNVLVSPRVFLERDVARKALKWSQRDEQEVLEHCTFNPQINSRSHKLARKSRCKIPKKSIQHLQPQGDNCTFSPSVNQVPDRMKEVRSYVQLDPFQRLADKRQPFLKKGFVEFPVGKENGLYDRQPKRLNKKELSDFFARVERSLSVKNEKIIQLRQQTEENSGKPKITQRSDDIVRQSGKRFDKRLSESIQAVNMHQFRSVNSTYATHPFSPQICSKSRKILSNAQLDKSRNPPAPKSVSACDKELTFNPKIKQISEKRLQKMETLRQYLKLDTFDRLTAKQFYSPQILQSITFVRKEIKKESDLNEKRSPENIGNALNIEIKTADSASTNRRSINATPSHISSKLLKLKKKKQVIHASHSSRDLKPSLQKNLDGIAAQLPKRETAKNVQQPSQVIRIPLCVQQASSESTEFDLNLQPEAGDTKLFPVTTTNANGQKCKSNKEKMPSLAAAFEQLPKTHSTTQEDIFVCPLETTTKGCKVLQASAETSDCGRVSAEKGSVELGNTNSISPLGIDVDSSENIMSKGTNVCSLSSAVPDNSSGVDISNKIEKILQNNAPLSFTLNLSDSSSGSEFE